MVNDKGPMIIGVDPGTKGALVAYYPKEKEFMCHRLADMVPQEKGLKFFNPDGSFEELNTFRKCDKFFIEDVHAMPTDGVSSAFQFGLQVGQIHGAAWAHGIEIIRVRPQQWQQVLGLPKEYLKAYEEIDPKIVETKRIHAKKSELRKRTNKWFVQEYIMNGGCKITGVKNVTAEIADAFCIAIYGAYMFQITYRQQQMNLEI